MTLEEQNQTPVTSGAEVVAVATKDRTAVGDFLFKIKTTVIDLTNAAAKVFHQLSEKEQLMASWASGIVAAFNASVDSIPDEVFAVVQALFPTISREYVEAKTVLVSNMITRFNSLVVSSSAEAAINIKTYLGSFTGNDWITVTKQVVMFFFNVFSPDTTILEKVAYGLEWAYNHVIKPKLMLLLAA
jgi:hypothetical protein